ncbi:MAG: uracil-DNA glycosylase family protein [Terrimicrobiaceae bacterium]|nr:uracil-DNA glycosylase family protein [Terrimicrobiaceae bacterium]
MPVPTAPPHAIEPHLAALRSCDICPGMHKPAVVGRPVGSRILLVGQAPGVKEPVLGRPFAWTAGKTLFKWIESALGWPEDEARERIYFAAVCRCFPGKNPKGGDRVPDPAEIANCAQWLRREFEILRPALILPVGKLAISQFLPFGTLAEVVGRAWPVIYAGHACDLLPLPHPSGASTWHRMEPGRTLLARALDALAAHPAAGERQRS